MTRDTISFAEIVAELERICAAKKTGTLYITSQLNRSAQLMVDKGSIVYLYYFNKRGRDALHLMPEISSGRCRFQEGSVPALRSEPLMTDDILRYLKAAASVDEGADVAGQSASGAGVEPSGAPRTSLSDEQKRQLEEGLALYIGPMAAIICEDHLTGSVDLQMAVARLAGEIPAEAQAKTFREDMLKRLAG